MIIHNSPKIPKFSSRTFPRAGTYRECSQVHIWKPVFSVAKKSRRKTKHWDWANLSALTPWFPIRVFCLKPILADLWHERWHWQWHCLHCWPPLLLFSTLPFQMYTNSGIVCIVGRLPARVAGHGDTDILTNARRIFRCFRISLVFLRNTNMKLVFLWHYDIVLLVGPQYSWQAVGDTDRHPDSDANPDGQRKRNVLTSNQLFIYCWQKSRSIKFQRLPAGKGF